MKILIVETQNTLQGATVDDMLSKFAICRNYKEKNRVLSSFVQPNLHKRFFLTGKGRRNRKTLLTFHPSHLFRGGRE